MLGPHYISQKPDKARAHYPPKPTGFVASLIDGLGDKFVRPEPDPVPNLKARARPEPKISDLMKQLTNYRVMKLDSWHSNLELTTAEI